MKNMRALIDTNIVLDWLMRREPFHQQAERILRKCMNGNLDGYLTSHMLTDMFYILRKQFDVSTRKQLLLLLCNNFNIIVEDKETIISVLSNRDLPDLEDGLQMECASKYNMDYIITRNVIDFEDSAVTVVTPEEFLNAF